MDQGMLFDYGREAREEMLYVVDDAVEELLVPTSVRLLSDAHALAIAEICTTALTPITSEEETASTKQGKKREKGPAAAAARAQEERAQQMLQQQQQGGSSTDGNPTPCPKLPPSPPNVCAMSLQASCLYQRKCFTLLYVALRCSPFTVLLCRWRADGGAGVDKVHALRWRQARAVLGALY